MLPILLLSPLQSIADLAPEIARELGIDIHIELADDNSAQNRVREHPEVEIVLTRGGLAEHVRQLPGISVIEIATSLNELLGSLSSLTASGVKRIGIVSRPNLLNGATGHFDICSAQISVHPQDDEASIQSMVEELVGQGIEAIIGCRMAHETAQRLGVRAVLLESEAVSIRAALQEAMRLLAAKEQEKLRAAQLRAIIDNIDEAVVAISMDGEVSFFNRHARRICSTGPQARPDFSQLLLLLGKNKTDGPNEQVLTINGNRVVARSIALALKQVLRGQVITLHEVARIQASESRIRASFHEKGLYARYQFKDVVGESALMQQLVAKAKNYAGHDANLLIYGETGTGKEVFAQSIHNHSKRRQGPFVSINIASIPPSLLESELFGYVDGAFTGARKGGKPGLFELAHQGTLFLDEIGELAPEIQNRFLRVLQEREIMRIGDDRMIPVDVRIISATNRDLYQQTQNGSFRQDLYYRIHVVGLRLPPLRERNEDIPSLFEHFLGAFSASRSRPPRLTATGRKLLQATPWPGNIRQLRNVAEVISYAARDDVDSTQIAEVLGDHGASPTTTGVISISERRSLKEMEVEIIRQLLARHSPDAVCARLGISRVTLWRKMKTPGSS